MSLLNEYLRFGLWILIFTQGVVICYNVDTEHAILYKGNPPENYFGFSVGLIKNKNGYRALITAPKANSTYVMLHQPGALFSCNVPTDEGNSICEEVAVDRKGNEFQNDKHSSASYWNKRDDMWLGVSLDTQQFTNNVVVCGHLWKNEMGGTRYYSNGACYVLNSDLNPNTVDKIVPFLDAGVNYRYPGIRKGHALAGTSSTFSEDGLTLLLGCPGYSYRRGSIGPIVSYQLDPTKKTQNLKDPIIPRLQDPLFGGTPYVGYSITSGKFFGDRTTYIAVGAPRDNDYKGKVYIFWPLRQNQQELHPFLTEGGKQTAEYFGASVCGIDLNRDNLTDLLVGAPFYSKESGGDEGKVYVYFGSRNKIFVSGNFLIGSNKPNARFGTCIGNTGDLNQDGYNDVAIGAPYEDEKGAVYIYHGRQNGIHRNHAQRICAEEFTFPVSGFGISISRGLDVDDNFYPDILIGSYASSNAVLLRTYPVIRLRGTVSFSVKKINTNVTACDIGDSGGKFPCINVTYCLMYSGKNVKSALEFQIELMIDTERRKGMETRGFFLAGAQKKSSVSNKMQITGVQDSEKGECLQETAYIYKNIRDEINPIQFSLSYDLDRNATISCQNAGFQKGCPVIDPRSPTTGTGKISFEIDCKGLCDADLSVEAHIAGNPENRTLIVGQNTSLTVVVTVRNSGEPAYGLELFITLPPETPLVKYTYDQCEMERNQQEGHVNTTLNCKFRGALKKGETAKSQVVIDTENIPRGTSSLTMYFRATTISVDTNSTNNALTLPVFFESAADVNITGNPENPRIPQTEERGTVSITHNYYVKYYGPSPVDKIGFNLYVPSSIKGENDTVTFLTENDFVSDSGEISIKCTSTFTNVGNEQPLEGSEAEESNRSITHRITKRSSEESTTHSTAKRRKDYTLDCETAKCEVIHCDAGPFRSGQKSIKFVLTVQVDLDALSNVMEAWNIIEFITKGEISMAGVRMLSNHYRNETMVGTAILCLQPPGTKEVERWIIFVSIGVGLLLLFIILAVLIKMGFFKRKQRERMRSMRQQVHAKEMQTMCDVDAKEVADDNHLCSNDESGK